VSRSWSFAPRPTATYPRCATFIDAASTVFAPRFDVPSPSLEGFSTLQRHVLATGVGYVAEEEGEVVGFGSAWSRGDDWFLACLFVRGRAQGRGVGPRLLDAVWGDARRRRTVTDAIQPVSNVLYGGRGLVPATPLLTFSGVPRLDAHAEEGLADVLAIDAVAYGFDRTIDHRYWEIHARRTEWGDAYSYVFPSGASGRSPAQRGAARRARRRACSDDGAGEGHRLGARARRGCAAGAPRLGDVPGFVLLARRATVRSHRRATCCPDQAVQRRTGNSADVG
jgi:hypothetical protein